MSTNSSIGMLDNDGKTITAIYCHWDGYPEHHLPILQKYYKTASSVQCLLDLGHLSELDINTEMCKFYGRDMGEPRQDTEKQEFVSKKRWMSQMKTCEFFYLFDLDEKWNVFIPGVK
jgi:hypothetical protein